MKKLLGIVGVLFLLSGCNNSGVPGSDNSAGAGSGASGVVAPSDTSVMTFMSPPTGVDGSAGLSSIVGNGSFGSFVAPEVIAPAPGSTFLDPSSGGSIESMSVQIAKVHNPEPASMILMGIGLAGAAMRRRKAQQ